MNSLENLIAYYNSCKRNDLSREVIRHILHNLKKIEDSSIYELAEMCYVSPATISKLSRKLGYKSFIDLKVDLVNSVKNYETRNRYVPLNEIGKYGSEQNAYLELMNMQIKDFTKSIDNDLILNIIQSIHNCKKISFYTYGICFSEPHFQEDLIMAGHDCGVFPVIADQLQDIETLDENSMVIILVPVVSESAAISRVINLIRERKAKIVLLTDSKHTNYLRFADFSYCFDGSLSIIDDYRFSMFINLLSINYRNKYIV